MGSFVPTFAQLLQFWWLIDDFHLSTFGSFLRTDPQEAPLYTYTLSSPSLAGFALTNTSLWPGGGKTISPILMNVAGLFLF